MSTKFEQLLDYIVNEEMDKANELFHEIVVEKSRTIYENLIAQESEEEGTDGSDDDLEESDDDLEESDDDLEESDDDLEESDDDLEESENEETDESFEIEDSYGMEEGGDDMPPEPSAVGDATDDLEGDVSAEPEEEVELDIQQAIEQLQAALDKLDGTSGDMGADDEFSTDDGETDDELPAKEMMGVPAMESKKRITREYTEKVGNDWDKSGSMKTQKQYVGAGTGDKEGAPNEGKSPIANLAKPGPTGVSAKNLNQGATEGQSNTGTSPGKVSKGLPQHSGEKLAAGMHNVDGKKSGVKTLSNVKGGHGAEKKGAGPGPVGSGTGDKAGQTSVPGVKQFLKPYSK